MANWTQLESQFVAKLALGRRPVAVSFLDAEPAGLTPPVINRYLEITLRGLL